MDLHETHEDEPFRILVGTMLSAQTKDGVTAVACKRLFRRAKSFKAIERLSEKDIRELIYPVSFYRTKAKHLKQTAVIVREEYSGRILETIDELVKLPGVGRKTANLVVQLAFGEPAICVDTHVHRIMNRFGYVETRTPLETEMALRDKLPKRLWNTVNRNLVAYGQHTCTPVSPKCSECPIKKHCGRVGVTKSR